MNRKDPHEAHRYREAMMECARAMQKRPPLDEADFTFYFKKLEDVTIDIVVAALDALSKEQNYFPTVARIRERADRIIFDLRAEAWKTALQACPHDNHWIEVADAAGVVRTKRCPCWEQGITAAKAIGERLALPPPPPVPREIGEEG